jgi:hypothetical protein
MVRMANAKSKGQRSGAPNYSNATGFNFLEKLLVFRVMETTTVPSNPIDKPLRFEVSQRDGDFGICFLIHVDAAYNQLFGDSGKRPDYLSMYIRNDLCICTIIELKLKDVDEAIEQITRFKAILTEQFNNCLHPSLHPHIQGMIITPPNVQSPNRRLDSLQKNQLAIRHHMITQEYDICSFVSKKILREDMYKDPPATEKGNLRKPTVIERLLRVGAVKALCTYSSDIRSGRDGITINYSLPAVGTAVLHTTAYDKHFHFFVSNQNFAKRLNNEIRVAGLDRKIKVFLRL